MSISFARLSYCHCGDSDILHMFLTNFYTSWKYLYFYPTGLDKHRFFGINTASLHTSLHDWYISFIYFCLCSLYLMIFWGMVKKCNNYLSLWKLQQKVWPYRDNSVYFCAVSAISDDFDISHGCKWFVIPQQKTYQF